MNLIGIEVIHATLGLGIITSFDAPYLTVQFSSKTTKFVYPNIFLQFLHAKNPDIHAKIIAEIGKEREQHNQEHKPNIHPLLSSLRNPNQPIITRCSAKPDVPVEHIPGQRKIFYVFQGASYESEYQGGYIWAPKTNKIGQSFHHWERLLDVRAGDIILHGCNGSIRAISTAQGVCYDSIQPKELQDSELWDLDGRRIDCNYIQIEHPIKTSSFKTDILRLCAVKYAPFNKDGNGNLGYLYALNRELACIFITAIVKANPNLADIDFVQEVLEAPPC